MAPAKKPTKKSNSAEKMKNNKKTEVKKSPNIKKKTTVGKALEKKKKNGPQIKNMKQLLEAKKVLNTAKKSDVKKTPAMGLLSKIAKKMPVKKIASRASAVQKKEKKTMKKSGSPKSGKKVDTTKPIPTKAKLTRVTGGQKQANEMSSGMRKPVIVIKSVDVTESPAKETGETSKKKEEEEEVRKEMSVYDEGQEEVVKMQKISIWRDLATFVKSRLGSIDSSSVPEVEYEVTLETALVSLLPDFEVEVGCKVVDSLPILATIITLFTLANVRRALQSALRRRPPTGRWSSTGTCCSSRRSLSAKVQIIAATEYDHQGGHDQRRPAHWLELGRLQHVAACPGCP